MNKNLVTVGEFADLAVTTKRTVQYYDKIGLLKPFKVDDNGYRYYKQRQVLDFQIILLLQKMDFTLDDIKALVSKDSSFEELFLKQRARVRNEIERMRHMLKMLTYYYKNLDDNGTMIEPSIKQVDSFDYYYLDKVGSYSEIEGFCIELVNMFSARPEKAATLAVFYDKCYKPKDSKMRIGIIDVKGLNLKKEFKDELKKTKLPSFRALTYMHKGSGKTLSLFWKELEKYARKYGFKQNSKGIDFYDMEVYWKVSEREWEQEFEIFLPIN